MYLTQTNVIRNLNKKEFQAIKDMCHYSNNLYNYGLYCIRKHYFETNQFLSYESNYHVCKENENYALLQAGVSQQILRVLDRSFKSFFDLIRKAKCGEYHCHDISIPHYRTKGGLFLLVLQKNSISVKKGFFKVPMSREFKKLHNFDIKIPYPVRLLNKELKEVRILPCSGGRVFKIQYVYEEPEINFNLKRDNFLAIDLGVDNLATCVSNVRTPFIVDGRNLKSINWHWNKEKARLQSVLDKQHVKGGKSNKIYAITEKRNRRINDSIKKAARYIINDCIANDIGTLVVGYNKDFKRNINIGKRNNQSFVQLPLGDLRLQLRNLCERYGMNYIEQEESYTSKASYMDNDFLPVYRSEQRSTRNFSGKRIHRGLYKTKDGNLINADVNGAANISRKVNGSNLQPCIGLLASPQRIRLSEQTSLESLMVKH